MTQKERRDHIDSIRTARGGFTKKDLAEIGVDWPPKKGWKKKFIYEGETANKLKK